MEHRTIIRRRVLRLPTAVVLVALALVVSPSGAASADHADCRLTVQGPFLYAGMVFPVVEIQCDTVKQSIRIDAAIDRDGVQVATSSRTCRKASYCVTGLASDGIFTDDVPGDQQWCGRATGVIHRSGPRHTLPQMTSCESESF